MPPSQTRRTDGVDGPRATFSKPRTTTGLTDRRQRQDIGEWGGEAGRDTSAAMPRQQVLGTRRVRNTRAT